MTNGCITHVTTEILGEKFFEESSDRVGGGVRVWPLRHSDLLANFSVYRWQTDKIFGEIVFDLEREDGQVFVFMGDRSW
jgi:hypothetical protein